MFSNMTSQVCPANWNPGQATIKATPDGIKEYHQSNPTASDTKMAEATNGTVPIKAGTNGH